MDNAIFYAVNRGMQNSLFDWLMPALSRYANWIPVGIAVFGYFMWRDGKKGVWLFFVTALAVTLSDFIASHILKELFARPRPCISLPDVHLLMGCSTSGSLPSSHAANSATIAAALGFYDRKMWFIALPSAIAVSFSRVYVGVHYPLDVVMGAMVGFGIGWAAIRASRLNTVAPATSIK